MREDWGFYFYFINGKPRYYFEYIARCLSLNAFFSHGLIHSHHVSSTSFVPDLMLPFSSPHVVNRPHSIETYTKGFHGVNHVFHSHAIDDRSFCITCQPILRHAKKYASVTSKSKSKVHCNVCSEHRGKLLFLEKI